MSNRTLLPIVSFVLLCAAASAADRKAAITAGTPSVTTPVLGSFTSSEGTVVVEGVPGAAQARLVNGRALNSSEFRKIALSTDAAQIPAAAGRVSQMVVSDDESTTLVAAENGVYEKSGDGWHLITSEAASALAFLPHRTDALVATKDRLYLIKAGALQLATSQGIDSPLAIAASDDAAAAIVLNAGGVDVRLVDLKTGTEGSLKLGAPARDIVRGSDATTFLFVPQQGVSPWLLDMNTGQLSFAPALPGGRAAHQPPAAAEVKR